MMWATFFETGPRQYARLNTMLFFAYKVEVKDIIYIYLPCLSTTIYLSRNSTRRSHLYVTVPPSVIIVLNIFSFQYCRRQ